MSISEASGDFPKIIIEATPRVNFLTKPFQASKLAQTIRDSLDKPA
jgi:FixJ family two-component response regulator